MNSWAGFVPSVFRFSVFPLDTGCRRDFVAILKIDQLDALGRAAYRTDRSGPNTDELAVRGHYENIGVITDPHYRHYPAILFGGLDVDDSLAATALRSILR